MTQLESRLKYLSSDRKLEEIDNCLVLNSAKRTFKRFSLRTIANTTKFDGSLKSFHQDLGKKFPFTSIKMYKSEENAILSRSLQDKYSRRFYFSAFRSEKLYSKHHRETLSVTNFLNCVDASYF